jgi:hypothetical protein
MLLREKNKVTAGILMLTAALIFMAVYYFAPREVLGEFSNDIEQCNFIEKQLRFSCYRSVIEKYNEGDLDKFLEKIENNTDLTFRGKDTSYAIFGTNCHTFYHAVGDFIASSNTELDTQSALDHCSLSCTNACMMGLYKRTALENDFSSDLLGEFYEVCREGEKHQCAHEIGHLLHDKYTVSILGILDELTSEHYGFVYPREYNYALFENPDLDAPFEECRQILPEGEFPYCYTGVGHNLFLFSEFSPDGYKTQLQECVNIGEANQENCFGFLLFRIGINSVAPKFLSSQFVEGNEICEDAVGIIGRDDLLFHCYKGVGGGIGLFIESEYPEYFIDAELPIFDEEYKLDDIRNIKRSLTDFARLCEASPEKLETECFQGLLGTRFRTLYLLLGVEHEKIEGLLPDLDDFEVSG